jgi:hypothetical protein
VQFTPEPDFSDLSIPPKTAKNRWRNAKIVKINDLQNKSGQTGPAGDVKNCQTRPDGF